WAWITQRRTDSFPTPSRRAIASAAAVSDAYSWRWSRTWRTQRSLTLASIFLGMVRILPTQKDAASNPGRFKPPLLRGRHEASLTLVASREHSAGSRREGSRLQLIT